ncbi:hypothetical protein TNCV_4413031 [Trichonephila clavipes]|nr:hypothetical protein TNCV_4413031 [Trichonephila clavipes]
MVLNGTGFELVTRPATIRYLDHSATVATTDVRFFLMVLVIVSRQCAKSRVQVLMSLQIRHIEKLMHVRSAMTKSPHFGVVLKLGECCPRHSTVAYSYTLLRSYSPLT